MVLLKKLSSETNLFESINFKSGINFIKGIYTKGGVGCNGIGKSSLVRLIDFALLSKDTVENFFNSKKNPFFKGHSVKLEFTIEGQSYYIKRSLDDENNPYFGNDPIHLEKYRINELRQLLGDLFFGKEKYEGYFDPKWFRTLIRFYIKDDLKSYKRDDPLNFIDPYTNKNQVYYYNLFLLGLPNKEIYELDAIEKEKKDLKTNEKQLNKKIQDETGKKIEEINSEIFAIDEKITQLNKALKEYRFLESYKAVEIKIVKISEEISNKLRELTSFERKLKEYENIFELDIEFDKERVVKLYTEIKKEFGDLVRKQLDNVLNFRKNLAKNRERFYNKKIEEIKKIINKLTTEISELEIERSNLYKFLEEKEALDSIKNNYSKLIEEKVKKQNFKMFLEQAEKTNNQILKCDKIIAEKRIDISEKIKNIENKAKEISSLYLEIVKSCLGMSNVSEAYFNIGINIKPSIANPVEIKISVPKVQALGKSRFLLLAYDLTNILYNIKTNRNLPRFLIHDGVFQGIDIKTIINTLNYVYSNTLKYPNFQYIFTANQEEIYVSDDLKLKIGDYNFNLDDQVIVVYEDIPEKMIFKREFS